MDFRQTVEDAMGGFETLVKKIPGYSGYKEKEQRREADALLREHLAREFEAQWTRMNDLKTQMLIGPAMAQLDDMGRASRKLQTLIDKIKAAAQGYAGFFDAVKVKEEQLNALYNFDNQMLDNVGSVAQKIDAIQTALDNQEDVSAPVRDLDKLISEMITTFNKRNDAILDVIIV